MCKRQWKLWSKNPRRNHICNNLNMEHKLMFFIIKNGGKDVMYNADNIQINKYYKLWKELINEYECFILK